MYPPRERGSSGSSTIAVQQLKAAAARDISVGGPTLGAHALKSGLVDEFHLFLSPIVVGAGTQALPDNIRELELLDEHRFGNGVVHLLPSQGVTKREFITSRRDRFTRRALPDGHGCEESGRERRPA